MQGQFYHSGAATISGDIKVSRRRSPGFPATFTIKIEGAPGYVGILTLDEADARELQRALSTLLDPQALVFDHDRISVDGRPVSSRMSNAPAPRSPRTVEEMARVANEAVRLNGAAQDPEWRDA